MILVLAPHIDDEVLGCFSYLNANTFVHVFGAEDREYVSRTERISELTAVAAAASFDFHVADHTVNQYAAQQLIGEIEMRINELKPETLVIPDRSSYNQDHRAVYDAALVASRPHDTNWLVPQVLSYEQPHVAIWPHGERQFTPNYFRPIDVQKKIALYELHGSQVRGHRSTETLTALARLRGAAINVPYAEAYCCMRMIER